MKKRKESKHVRIYHYMSKTPAWKSLNGNERATYLLLAERYMGLNNGKIPYSVRELAAELGLSLSTAKQCLDRLQARGFHRCHEEGRLQHEEATRDRMAPHRASLQRLRTRANRRISWLATRARNSEHGYRSRSR